MYKWYRVDRIPGLRKCLVRHTDTQACTHSQVHEHTHTWQVSTPFESPAQIMVSSSRPLSSRSTYFATHCCLDIKGMRVYDSSFTEGQEHREAMRERLVEDVIEPLEKHRQYLTLL